MSSFLKELTNPLTGKKQVAFCIDDYFGRHNYGYGFRKDEEDAEFDGRNQSLDCDWYKEEDIEFND